MCLLSCHKNLVKIFSDDLNCNKNYIFATHILTLSLPVLNFEGAY